MLRALLEKSLSTLAASLLHACHVTRAHCDDMCWQEWDGPPQEADGAPVLYPQLSEILWSSPQLAPPFLRPQDHLHSEKLFRQTTPYLCSGPCFPHLH